MKYLLSIMLSMAFGSNLLAQVPAFPDSTFNGTGRKVFSLGTNVLNYGDNIVLQPDGKIIMTGATFDGGLGGLTKLGVCRLLPDGSYDPAFGIGGISKVDLGTLGYNGGFEPEIVLLTDGSMLINGFTQEGGSTGDDLLVCKLLSNGNLDPSFGSGGKVWVDLFGGGSPDAAYAITTDASGNIYACGSTRTGGTPFTNDVAVIKLTPAGVLDPSFSGDGKILLDVSGNWDFGYGIHVRSDGKIIIGGYAGLPANFFALRLLPDGSYDNSFSGDGKVTIDIFGQNVADEVWGMSVDPDGKILLVGDGIDASAGSISKGAIVRLTADGAPDPTFDGDGIATFAISTAYNVLRSITRLPDGRYVAAGEASVNMDKDYFVVRIMNDGSPDVSFNTTGIYTLDLTGLGSDDFGYGLAIQPDSKILVSGNTVVSEFSNQKYSIARITAPGVVANFTASATLLCAGSQVQFTSTSMGQGLSYQWSFEGGTPSTSVLQNPLVTYNSSGLFDVELIVYNSEFADTLLLEDMIEVITIPVAPAIPVGPSVTCNLQNYQYTIAAVPTANTYSWVLDPVTAGFLSPNGTSATFTAASSWTGPFTLKVNATNQCGTSAWSELFNGTVNHMPQTYTILSNGVYCEGTSGAVITTTGSETGVDYELYLNNVPTGSILSGTGSPLEWNNIVEQGFYTVTGFTASCSQSMVGQIYISMLTPPVQLTQPSGPTKACNNANSIYTTQGGSPSDLYVWTLTPAEAGSVTSSANQAVIDWTDTFTGNATLSVHAENSCGEGAESEVLGVEVSEATIPAVTGLQTSCLGWTLTYETEQHPGSTYNWTITGGTLASGAGTSQVTVYWGSAGTGSVSVSETNAAGCEGVSQLFEVVVDACVGMPGETGISELKVFPNPSEGAITVEGIASCKNATALRIIDLTGRIILNRNINPGTQTLLIPEAGDLAGGTYMIELTQNGRILERKMFIRK